MWMEVMGVFTKKWRQQGLLVFVYLDDILLLAKSKTLATQQTEKMLLDLRESGILINTKKSKLLPCQELEHLGFQIDLL